MAVVLLAAGLLSRAQVAISTSYFQDFDSLGIGLPAGWEVWTSSTSISNGSSFTWSTTPVANNASPSGTSYFRNLPGAGQSWSAGLSSGTDRALGWRAGSAASRDGAITFSLSNTSGFAFASMSFKLFTPNSSGTDGPTSITLQYQIGSTGTFDSFTPEVSYTSDTAGDPLTITTITLTALQLTPLNDLSGPVTLRFDNTGTTGTAWPTIALDDFSYTATAIPEPATSAMIFGLLVLAAGLIGHRHWVRSP